MTTNLSWNHSNNYFISLNTLRPTQNGRHFPDDIFKWIFLNENVWISIKLKLKFVPNVPINNIPVLVQIKAWRRSGDKPLSEPMMDSLLTHICVTRSQWVKVKSFCLSDRLPIKSQCCVIWISDTTPSCVLQSGHDSVHKRMGIQRETSMPPINFVEAWGINMHQVYNVDTVKRLLLDNLVTRLMPLIPRFVRCQHTISV